MQMYQTDVLTGKKKDINVKLTLMSIADMVAAIRFERMTDRV